MEGFIFVCLMGLVFFLILLPYIRDGYNSTPKSENGYALIRTESGHYQYEHRYVAEEILGRPLKRGEVVHHINGRRKDNCPSNLCVMNFRDHDRYHAWYDWILENYGNYPRRETQLAKLRTSFNGRVLSDYIE